MHFKLFALFLIIFYFFKILFFFIELNYYLYYSITKHYVKVNKFQFNQNIIFKFYQYSIVTMTSLSLISSNSLYGLIYYIIYPN